jgi:hypothetical protein
MVVLPLAVIAGIGLLLGYAVVIGLRRFREPLDAPQPISLLVAEQVARSVLRYQLIAISLGVAGAITVSALDVQPLALIALVLIGPAMIDAVIASRVLRWIGKPGAIAAECASVILVHAGGRTARLGTSSRAIARAKRRGIPAGKAR